MSESQAREGGSTEDVSAQAVGDTSAEPPRKAVRSPSEAIRSPSLIAQIPDVAELGQTADGSEGSGRRDGRILSPGLSAKILLGGGLFLLLVAVMPLLFGSKDDPESLSSDGASFTRESPAPQAPAAPRREGKTAQELKQKAVEAGMFQAGRGGVGRERAEVPAVKGQPQVAQESGWPQTPVRYTAPPALAERSPIPARYPNTQDGPPYDARERGARSEPNRSMAIRDSARAPVRYDRETRERDYSAANRPTAIGDDRRADPRAYPRDYRRDDPNARRPEYPRTQQAGVPAGAPAHGGAYRRECADGYRSGNTGGSRHRAEDANRTAYRDRADSRSDYYPGEPSARVVDRRPAAASRYPTTSGRPVEEPGVARFKGIIEKPTVRTGYDGAGSSIY